MMNFTQKLKTIRNNQTKKVTNTDGKRQQRRIYWSIFTDTMTWSKICFAMISLEHLSLLSEEGGIS